MTYLALLKKKSLTTQNISDNDNDNKTDALDINTLASKVHSAHCSLNLIDENGIFNKIFFTKEQSFFKGCLHILFLLHLI